MSRWSDKANEQETEDSARNYLTEAVTDPNMGLKSLQNSMNLKCA